jgi:hypothetical protein
METTIISDKNLPLHGVAPFGRIVKMQSLSA